ncbi:hypothetical protein ACFS7Z_22275 [Pontibacter toksunensis]|uniref:Uncharacterized protein n=1 Tax=Pontibacter toksunensis TaxID=1332631 RepID=A0ABW6BZW3_9BACT
MNKQLILLTSVTIAITTSCTSKADEPSQVTNSYIANENSFSNPDVDYSNIPSTISKYDKHYLNSLLNIVESETKYNSDFVPTVHLKVQNATDKTVVAFEVEAENMSGVNKRFKANIKPNSTYSTSFKVDSEEETSGEVVVKVSRIVFSDGHMEI